MGRWQRHAIDIYAAIVIALATALRVILLALNWPPTNSDEGTMAIMALNITYHGAHPYIYYGQNYMGVIEAYLGALFFHLLGGPSLFALRLGVVLMVTLFFMSTYLLARLLFTPGLALLTLLVLSVGSIPFLTRQTIATGGSTQTLLFGSLAFLCVAWLTLNYQRPLPRPLHTTFLRRLVVYALLGLIIGLGLWSDMVVLPFFAMAGLLLLLFCWREVFTWAWLVLLATLSVGIQPLVRYDLVQGLNPLQILLGLMHGSDAPAPHTISGILHGIKETILISIPTATGNPFCPVIEIPQLGDNTPPSITCTLAHATWGGGYLVLLAGGLIVTILTLWRLRTQMKGQELQERRRSVVRRMAQLLMQGAALLTLSAYAVSSGPVSWPAFHARYLIGLLIVTPALIEPLWHAASGDSSTTVPLFAKQQYSLNIMHLRRVWYSSSPFRTFASRAILILLWCTLLAGTLLTFGEVPAAITANQQRLDLIHNLEHLHIQHIYTDYWSCNNIAFASDEQVICGVVDTHLQPSHNRAPGYYEKVHADIHAAYVFPVSSPLSLASSDGLAAAAQMVATARPGQYHTYTFDGYVVYLPA